VECKPAERKELMNGADFETKRTIALPGDFEVSIIEAAPVGR
jgi:hypothetical protein